MPLIINSIIQGGSEWQKIRVGIPTASNFHKIVDSKGNPSKQRQKYLYELAGEMIRGVKTESYQSAAMLRGIEQESSARSLYEFINDIEVQLVGFCFQDDSRMVGGSPDGLISDDGGIEIKTAEAHIQVDRLLNGWSLAEHYQQVEGYLMICDRKWFDLMSYSEGLPSLIQRVERNEVFIEKLKAELNAFCLELSIIVSKLKAL